MHASQSANLREFVCSFVLSRECVFVREFVGGDERACVFVCLSTCVHENVRARVRSHLRACILTLVFFFF